MSVILNFAVVGLLISATAGFFPSAATASLYALLVNTQFLDQVIVKNTSQLIKCMSIVLKNCSSILMTQQFQHFLFFYCHLLILL